MFDLCPCGTGKNYIACCGPVHGGAQAGDAQALMRARYSAYAKSNEAFLLRSWAPETRPNSLGLDPRQIWTKLDIKGHKITGPDTAIVHFKAHWRVGDRSGTITEKSRFRRDGSDWVYVDGDVS